MHGFELRFEERAPRRCRVRVGPGVFRLLVDDLASELDLHARSRVLDFIGRLRGQVMITALDSAQIMPLDVHQPPVKMFHVERGTVTELV